MARNRAIGVEGKMPWHLPGELQHFKQATMGKPIIMGRKTWESIGRALPGRQNIVVTRDRSYRADGGVVAGSLDSAIELAAGEEVMIIGGGELYRQALELSDRLILTLVDCEPEADTWFPQWRTQDWQQISSRLERADETNPHDFEVSEWIRKKGACDTSREPGKADGPPA